MSTCKVLNDRIDDILTDIEVFFRNSDSVIDINSIAEYVRLETGIKDFDLNVYYGNDEFKTAYNDLLVDYDLDTEEGVIPSSKSGDSIRTKSNVATDFNTHNITDLFHTLPLVKDYFEKSINAKVVKEILIGDPASKSFVESDEEVTRNLDKVKDNLFIEIQQFLISKKILKGKPKNLYTGTNEFKHVGDYGYYKQVMNLLSNYFFSGDNFTQIRSYTKDKYIPNLSDVDKTVLNAYNAGIFLNNFDLTLNVYFKNTLKVNYFAFNNLQSNLSTGTKYTRDIEGIKNPYWVSDSHASEGSEFAESNFTKLLISTIPVYNKKGEITNDFMEMKDLYLVAGKLAAFEIRHGNEHKDRDPNYKFLYEDAENVFSWYLDEILNDNTEFKQLLTGFEDIKEYIYSLKKYLSNPEFNIKTKEAASQFSITGILAQILLNNFGAAYLKYNANGAYTKQEMFDQNFANIKTQELVYNKLLRESKVDYESLKKDVNDLLKDKNSVESLDTDTLQKLSKIINKTIGIKLSPSLLREVVQGLEKEDKIKYSAKTLVNKVELLITAARTDNTEIQKLVQNNTLSAKMARGDISTALYIPNVNSDKLYKLISKAYLSVYPVKVVMNVEMTSGEKLPTFKLANLTYKDVAVLQGQRDRESSNSIFKSLLTGHQSVILGTGTKLELVNDKENKTAAKFEVSESYIGDFQYEFLTGLTTDKPSFSVMVGNYSDKSTILTKIINANFKYGKSNNLLIQESPETILEVLMTQGANYYKQALTQVVTDYEKILGLKVNIGSTLTSRATKINKYLAENSVRSLSKQASDLGINFTEELHYSKYSEGIRINQYLVDNYSIFSNKDLFEEFIARTEQSFIDKHNKYNVNSPNDIAFIGNFAKRDEDAKGEDAKNSKLEKALSALNLTKDQVSKGDKFPVVMDIVDGKPTLNPMLKKWIWLNAIFRNEYLFVTGKGEYVHPHKNKGLSSNRKLTATSTDEVWKEYFADMSGRLASMAKRNVVYTATIDIPIKETSLTVPKKVNHAVIDDAQDDLYNIKGDAHTQDIFDGSSFINYVYSRMIENSYRSKDYSGTKKQFATFITQHGVTIKKDAESIITNDKIRTSLTSPVPFLNKQKQMLDFKFSTADAKVIKDNIIFNKSFNQFYFNDLGEEIKINQLILTNDNTAKMFISRKVGNNWIADFEPRIKPFTSLFDLWNMFGAQYSTDSAGNFNEGSNELVYEIVTSVTNNDGKYYLKDNMIHIISNLSAVKAGGTNVNSIDSWKNDSPLAFHTFNNEFMGPQLDAGHETDASQIKEVTQVISALAQNPMTAHLANEAYADIAKVVDGSIQKYAKYINNFTPDNREKLRKYVSEKFVKTVEKSSGDTIAKVLVHSLGEDGIIPFSNQNFFVSFVRDIITRMNSEFITRYYSGTGAVLVPSHGIIQMYDLPTLDLEGNVIGHEIMAQSDLVVEALKNAKNLTDIEKATLITNDDIVKNYIAQKFPNRSVNWDQIQLGDTVEVSPGNNLVLNSPDKYYAFRSVYAGQKVTRVYNAPRDLRPAITTFKTEEGITYNTFDLDAVRLRFKLNRIIDAYNKSAKNPNDINLLSDWETVQEGNDFIILEKILNYLSKEALKNEPIVEGVAPTEPVELELIDQVNNKAVIRELQNFLLKWNKRSHELLEANLTYKPLTIADDISTLLNGDTLDESFRDAIAKYTPGTNVLSASDVTLQPAELILGDIYETKFGRDFNDSMYRIKQQGASYFENKIIGDYESDSYDADFKLIVENFENPIYVKYVDGSNLPAQKRGILKRNEEIDNILYVRFNEQGEEVYSKNSDKVVVVSEDGRDVIYIVSRNEGILDPDFKKNLNSLLDSFNGNVKTFVPLMNSEESTKIINKDAPKIETFNDITFKQFKYYTQYIATNTRFDRDWFEYNKGNITSQLSKKVYASWLKSHEFVAARIPSQSMQSFMPMKNVAYNHTKSNDAYVSIWQIWLQGSDKILMSD